MRYKLIVAAGLLLAGCSHTVRLIDAGTGASATFVVPPGQTSGAVNVTVDGRRYSGRWVYVSGPGSFSLGSAMTFQGAHSATGMASAIGFPTNGNGLIVLSAPGGSVIRCVFNYSRLSRTGMGACRRNDGKVFDLEIN